jgi:hypothetical protein
LKENIARFKTIIRNVFVGLNPSFSDEKEAAFISGVMKKHLGNENFLVKELANYTDPILYNNARTETVPKGYRRKNIGNNVLNDVYAPIDPNEVVKQVATKVDKDEELKQFWKYMDFGLKYNQQEQHSSFSSRESSRSSSRSSSLERSSD